MKLVAEYLEHVREFESIAASETNPRLKLALEREAAMYRRRAEVRAKQVSDNPALAVMIVDRPDDDIHHLVGAD